MKGTRRVNEKAEGSKERVQLWVGEHERHGLLILFGLIIRTRRHPSRAVSSSEKSMATTLPMTESTRSSFAKARSHQRSECTWVRLNV